jgi:hypothetical protein
MRLASFSTPSRLASYCSPAMVKMPGPTPITLPTALSSMISTARWKGTCSLGLG